MAIITQQVASFAKGLITAELDFDDTSGEVYEGRVINNSKFNAYLRVNLDPSVNGWSLVEVPGISNQTINKNFPDDTVIFKKQIDPDTGLTEWACAGFIIHCRWPI